MNLELLSMRLKEIEAAIVNAASQLNALHGHKEEVVHWIKSLLGKAEEDKPQVAPQEEPVVV